MLTISGLKNFYYIPGVTDMRCGYSRLLQIVKQMTHHDPFNGDVFVFMSKESSICSTWNLGKMDLRLLRKHTLQWRIRRKTDI